MPRNRSPRTVLLDDLTLDRSGHQGLQRQIVDGLRTRMLDGRLAAGAMLPSSRVLATELGVGRNTIVLALDQLQAEGYLLSRPGAGVFVTDTLPDLPPQGSINPVSTPHAGGLSERGDRVAATESSVDPAPALPLTPGVPALDVFPLDQWRRTAGRAWRQFGRHLLGWSDPQGLIDLRQAIAGYLGPARGVRCTADQVIILSSARQAIDLAARLLANPGDAIWFEDPGFVGARAVLAAAGLRLIPVPVDEQGLIVTDALSATEPARLAYVSPSHQYPLGGTLSLARRRALIDWANRGGGWIIEDDYDGEFRLHGRPLTALAGLDPHGRVLYVGTFSKSVYPGLRLAYVVLPPGLVPAFRRARVLIDGHAPTQAQATLALFIQDGAFAAHVRRMRHLYAARQRALLAALASTLAGRLTPVVAPAGLHLAAIAPPDYDDRALVQRLTATGFGPSALSGYYAGPESQPGLVLGFGGWQEEILAQAVSAIASAW